MLRTSNTLKDMEVSYDDLIKEREKLSSEQAILEDRILQKKKALGIEDLTKLPEMIEECKNTLKANEEDLQKAVEELEAIMPAEVEPSNEPQVSNTIEEF